MKKRRESSEPQTPRTNLETPIRRPSEQPRVMTIPEIRHRPPSVSSATKSTGTGVRKLDDPDVLIYATPPTGTGKRRLGDFVFNRIYVLPLVGTGERYVALPRYVGMEWGFTTWPTTGTGKRELIKGGFNFRTTPP